jgi:hypothetical protein
MDDVVKKALKEELQRVPVAAALRRTRSLERVKGIEPSYSAWKAAALPLSYTRMSGFSYQ